MDTIPDIIEAFGGPSSFARAIGVGTSTASEMKRRRSIPVEHWKRLIEAAEGQGLKGVTYEALALLHIEQKTRASNASAA